MSSDKPLVIEGAQAKQLPASKTLQTNASSTAAASLNLPQGIAPTSPSDGDVWTTSAGLYVRINGATIGPLSVGYSDEQAQDAVAAALVAGPGVSIIYNDAGNTLTFSASGGASGSADSTVSVGSFAKWATAIGRGSSNPARIAMIGDSNVAGQGQGSSTNGMTGGWAASFAHTFAGLGGYRTDHFFGDQNITIVGGGTGLGTYDPRMVLGTGWTSDTAGNQIAGGRFLVAPATSSGKLKFTPTAAFSKFRLWYPTTPGISTGLTVYVDGVLVDTINQTTAAALHFKDYTVSSATHFLEFGVGATGQGYVGAVETFNGTNTPSFFQLGFCGAKAADHNAAGAAWNSYNELVALALDYAIVYCTIVDTEAGTAKDTYYTNLESVVAGLAATADGCLCVGYPSSSGNTTNAYLDELAVIVRNIAADYGWSFYDMRRNLGRSQTRVTSRGYRFDNLHPNGSGGSAMANSLYSFLHANGL